jgi:dihydrolipoamide dehydrogenase
MVVGDIPDPADLLVVGGGPGGYATAIAGAQSGRNVTLVDRGEWNGLGGSCLHVGCIPSKALIELARNAVDAGATPGLDVGPLSIDLVAFQRHRETIVGGLAHGVAGLMKHYGVETVQGELRFTGARRVVVTRSDDRPRHIEFADVVIAVGARPVELPSMPFDGDRVLDSAGLLALETVPASLCVVGGGYIGLELGTALAKLGTKVTIVEATDDIASGFGPDTARLVRRSLERIGATILTGAVVNSLDPECVIVDTGDGSMVNVPAERVLVCVGRRPNTDSLGLDLAGVALDVAGRVIVDDAGLALPHVAAVGDVVDGPALAHKATAEASAAVASLGGRRSSRTLGKVPLVMFTDPEVASVGMTPDEAKQEGIEVGTATAPFSAVGRALTLGHSEGYVRLVLDRADETVVGAQIIGAHASELIAEATLAIEMGATAEDLALTIHAHPTLSEGVSEAAELSAGRPLHLLGRIEHELARQA